MNTTIKIVGTTIVVLGTHVECLAELAPYMADPETTNAICSVLCTISGFAFSVALNYLL